MPLLIIFVGVVATICAVLGAAAFEVAGEFVMCGDPKGAVNLRVKGVVFITLALISASIIGGLVIWHP